MKGDRGIRPHDRYVMRDMYAVIGLALTASHDAEKTYINHRLELRKDKGKYELFESLAPALCG